MTTSPHLVLATNENATHLRLALVVTDPEVVHELVQKAEGESRDVYAKQALRLGVLALRQASGALDAQTIQREGERMLGTVRELLVDRTGKFTDGLAQTLALHVGKQSPLFKLLSPEQSDGLVAALESTIQRALKAQADHVLQQFSLDRPDSALSRLGLELRGVLEAQAVSHTRFQTEMRATLEGIKVRREEAARSPRHGNTFEASVGDFLAGDAKRMNDTYEAVGTIKGHADRKTGDHVLILSPECAAPDARIVCEAKARKGYTEKAALEEIALARKNRDAQVGLVVMDRATAPEGLEVLRRVGQDILVVWDSEDVASDLNLRLALSVARALCVRAQMAVSQDEANLEQIDSSIEAIANQIGVVDEIIRSGRLIKQRGEKVTTSAEKLRETLETEVAALQKHLLALRKKDAA